MPFKAPKITQLGVTDETITLADLNPGNGDALRYVLNSVSLTDAPDGVESPFSGHLDLMEDTVSMTLFQELSDWRSNRVYRRSSSANDGWSDWETFSLSDAEVASQIESAVQPLGDQIAGFSDFDAVGFLNAELNK
jgi:hypothetical protein